MSFEKGLIEFEKKHNGSCCSFGSDNGRKFCCDIKPVYRLYWFGFDQFDEGPEELATMDICSSFEHFLISYNQGYDFYLPDLILNSNGDNCENLLKLLQNYDLNSSILNYNLLKKEFFENIPKVTLDEILFKDQYQLPIRL